MVSNVAGRCCGCSNIYNNQVALNDLSNMNMYPPNTMFYDPLLSMNNNSIFGPDAPYGMTPGAAGTGLGATPDAGLGITPGAGLGMTPGAGLGMMPGMGYMPPYYGGGSTGGAGNSTGDPYEDYFRQYERYQDFMIDNQVRMQQKQRSAGLRLGAPEEGVQAQAAILKDKIIRNEQGQIKGAYDAFVESVQALYGDNADRAQVINRANRHYMEANGGKSLMEDIREHGRDSFTQGALQSITFGLFNRKTAEETVSELTGQPVAKEENAKKVAGNLVGGAVVGGTTFALAKPFMKGLSIASKSKTTWGIIAGAAAGVIAAIIGNR